jgi:hypothetical protein
MKKNILFILIFLAFNATAQINTEQVLILSDTFCFSTQKPKPIIAGTKVMSPCDTVYIINKHRYLLYEKAANVVRDPKYFSTCSLLVQNYEDRIQAQNKAFTSLYNNYIKLDSISQKTITDTRNSLVQVNNTLISAQTNIGVVDKKMDGLKDTINQQRRKSFFDKIIYGVGGVALGILGGIVLVN